MADDPKVVLIERPVVNPELVERLEGLLDQARQGKLVGIVYGAARRDHIRATGWVSTVGYGHDLAAALLQVTASFASHLETGEEAAPL